MLEGLSRVIATSIFLNLCDYFLSFLVYTFIFPFSICQSKQKSHPNFSDQVKTDSGLMAAAS